MTWLWRTLLFVMVFTIEIRVKAETVSLPNSATPVQEPSGCLVEDSVCGIRTAADEKFRMKVGDAEVVLDASTTVVRFGGEALTLVVGTVWVKSKSPFKVRTEYGEAIASGGEFWVSRNDKRMVVSATEEEVILKPRNSGELRLDPGEENWLGPVARDGRGTSGVPRAIDLAAHVGRWARLYPGTRSEFSKDVEEFTGRWSRSLASIADYHRDLAERRRLVLEEDAQRRARIRAEEEAKGREMRALFRRKTLLE